MRADQVFSVTGKVAFVTGAAQGLGRAMAEALAMNGAAVVLFDRDARALAGVEAALAETGARVVACAGDVTDAASVHGAVAATVETFGALDICIANAGISDPDRTRLHDTTPEGWARTLDVNLNGVFHTVQAALKPMLAQGRGKVITVASMWGLGAPAALQPRPAYAATKGAVVNLTRELALEYARDNIQVNAICPGFFRTETRPSSSEQAAAFEGFTPMGRIAEAREIAGTVLYLASGASDFVTGTTLVIDGGVSAG
jgi:NAD(P)-dependent dehydrogenase (short-subunit alcohol dehydrogenase family)